MSTAEHDNTSMLIAWDLLKLKLAPEKWTVSDHFNSQGFFAWGWEARKQYDIPMQTRITELEAQQKGLQELHNALAANQSIWPNNWSQPVAMIAYHFHLMQAQLADAKQAARWESDLASQALADLAPYRKDAERYHYWRTHDDWDAIVTLYAGPDYDVKQGDELDKITDATIAEGKA